MRLDEFTNAEEQLALWKLVSDNVWTAINTQAQQQARARAEKQARAKLKPKRTRASPSAPYVPKPPPLKKPTPPHQTPHVTNGAISVQQANTVNPNKTSFNTNTFGNNPTLNTQANVANPSSNMFTPTQNGATHTPPPTLPSHLPTSPQPSLTSLQKRIASQKQAIKPI